MTKPKFIDRVRLAIREPAFPALVIAGWILIMTLNNRWDAESLTALVLQGIGSLVFFALPIAIFVIIDSKANLRK